MSFLDYFPDILTNADPGAFSDPSAFADVASSGGGIDPSFLGGGDSQSPQSYAVDPSGQTGYYGSVMNAPAFGDVDMSGPSKAGASSGSPQGSFSSQAADWLGKLAKGDKTALSQAKFGIGALGLLGSLFQSQNPRGQITPAQMKSMMASPYSNWTPNQQTSFNKYFNTPVNQFQYKPPNMANGGAVMPAYSGALASMASPMNHVARAMTGALGHVHSFAHGSLVRGQGGGQDDQVPARLSPGEYVFDADTVSALGDGSNEEGAKRLDQMRESIRTQKRSAPANKIPPKAKSPASYMRKS